jgi:hypothetical protein
MLINSNKQAIKYIDSLTTFIFSEHCPFPASGFAAVLDPLLEHGQLLPIDIGLPIPQIALIPGLLQFFMDDMGRNRDAPGSRDDFGEHHFAERQL